MKNANLTIITKPSAFPVGTKGGQWVFTIGNQGDSSHFDKAATSDTKWTFTVDDGAYWAEGLRVDSEGSQLGARARVEFTVEAENVLIETADTMGVTLSVPVAGLG
ncbi:MAG: hypothetical protein DRQ40_05740 [Gammaproteobacteria bacterium]|nr:MAG: hypothetical protein DRQ40_05740 [Gammaproteobacteria bacterium]